MNIPLGTQVTAGKELSEETVHDIISFMDGNKTGYFCVMTSGEHGMEDGLLVIENGNIVGAHYAYLAFGKEHVAGEALKRVLNSLVAPKGVYDSYTLSTQQLELLKIFNENVLLLERLPLRAFEGMVPVSHSDEYEKQEVAAVPLKQRDVLGKHGLQEIKIDNYAEIKAGVEAAVEKPVTAGIVADSVKKYLGGEEVPEPPTGEPTPEAPAPTPTETGGMAAAKPAPSPKTPTGAPAPEAAAPKKKVVPMPELGEPTEMPQVEEMPVDKPPEAPVPVEETLDEDTAAELDNLSQQAEKLRKLLLKEK